MSLPWPCHGRWTSGNVSLLSALAAFAVPAAFGVVQPLPAVPADATQPGLGHSGLLVGEPFRLGQGHPQGPDAGQHPALLLACRDPMLRSSIAVNEGEFGVVNHSRVRREVVRETRPSTSATDTDGVDSRGGPVATHVLDFKDLRGPNVRSIRRSARCRPPSRRQSARREWRPRHQIPRRRARPV
jgi:hypothetical protein